MNSLDVFEEWAAYAKKKVLYARDMDLSSIEQSSLSKIVAVIGTHNVSFAMFGFEYQKLK